MRQGDLAATPLQAALVLVAALALLVPIWGFDSFPSQDGPSHVDNARMVLLLASGRGQEIRPFYALKLHPFPNLFSHASLAAMMVVLEPLTAERVLLSAYVLLLPLSFRFALRGFRPGAHGLAYACLPFVYNRYLQAGFYNRAFGLIPLLLAIGVHARSRGTLGPRQTLVLALLLLWAYFCSPTAVVATLVTLALLALTGGTQEAPGAGEGPRARLLRLWHRVLPLLAASAPAMALLAHFRATQDVRVTGPGPAWSARAPYLTSLHDVVLYDPAEPHLARVLALALGCALILALHARFRRRYRVPEDGVLLSALLFAGMYFLAPATVAGGPQVGEATHFRLSLIVLVTLLLWLAAQPWTVLIGRLAQTTALATTLALIAVRLPHYAALNDLLAEYSSPAPRIPAGSTLLSISFDHLGVVPAPVRLAPDEFSLGALRHAAARLAAARGLVPVDNYEPDVGYFPITYRSVNLYDLLGTRMDRIPACVRLGRFNRQAPRPVDFVLVWRRHLADTDDPCVAASFAYLAAHYRRVYVSPRRAYAELFQRVD